MKAHAAHFIFLFPISKFANIVDVICDCELNGDLESWGTGIGGGEILLRELLETVYSFIYYSVEWGAIKQLLRHGNMSTVTLKDHLWFLKTFF